MSISREDVRHIAKLSRLKFSEEEEAETATHMSAVLGYFEMLSSVDTSGVQPTAHILDKVNVLREDVARAVPFDRDKLLQNAPQADGGAYIVQKVLE